MGYAKVAWVQICRPIDEGALGIPGIAALNRALIYRHLCELIIDPSSIWAKWVIQYKLRNKSLWTMNVTMGTWSWRKIGRLRMHLAHLLEYNVGNGNTFLLWHETWLAKGPLLHHFPRGPLLTGLPIDSLLNAVIQSRDWYWPASRRHVAGLYWNSATSSPGRGPSPMEEYDREIQHTGCIQALQASGAESSLECPSAWKIQDPEMLIYLIACYSRSANYYG
ncbi:UNVERIFIED_CONTAM: hypothetical protein Sradi_0206300 [Sesamum radiatum]|uniref:Uncharacterized protein n=1 Tax=Sesamum radiatum TaxID=300843 RepID=A0AAW2W180_SESRA